MELEDNNLWSSPYVGRPPGGVDFLDEVEPFNKLSVVYGTAEFLHDLDITKFDHVSAWHH